MIRLPPREIRDVGYCYPTFGDHNEHFGVGLVNKHQTPCHRWDATHGHWVIVWILRGQATFVDWHGQRHELRAGQALQRLPRHPHEHGILTDDYVELWLRFPESYHRLLRMFRGTRDQWPVLEVGLQRSLFDAGRALLTRLQRARPRDYASLLHDGGRLWERMRQRADAAQGDAPERALIDRALELLERDPHHTRTLPALAAELGLGYETFRKRFKAHVGLSPGDYRIRARVHAAQTQLVEHPDRSIADIASDSGYPDAFTFSKQFKKIVGQSPTAFRAQLQR